MDKKKNNTKKKTSKTSEKSSVKNNASSKKTEKVLEEKEKENDSFYDNEELSSYEKKQKPKSKSSIIAGCILLAILLILFGVSKAIEPKYLNEIKYGDFANVILEDKSIVYVGDSKDIKTILENIARDKGLKINYLSNSKLSDSEKEEVYGEETLTDMLIVNSEGSNYVYAGEYSESGITSFLADYSLVGRGIQEVSVSEYLDVIKKDGTHFMFIGSASCSWCAKYKPELEKVVTKYNIDTYYVDLSTISEEDYYALIGSNSYFTENEWGTPTSIIYKDGEAIDILSGYQDEAGIISSLQEDGVIEK